PTQTRRFSTISASHPWLLAFPTRRSSDLVCVFPIRNLPLHQHTTPFHRTLPHAEDHPPCGRHRAGGQCRAAAAAGRCAGGKGDRDRKSTRLNSSHVKNSYAVFCEKEKIIV